MEKLLFNSDKHKALIEQESRFNEITDNFENGFLEACSYKNNQFQEFDKWKAENKWSYSCLTGSYQKPIKGYTWDRKSFSELFELFEKETSK